MRHGLIALAVLAAACQPAPTAEDASAGASGAGSIPEATLVIEPEALVGLWSFDRSCASGDGMRLNADGTASYDEWGGGTWTLDADNNVVLTLERSEPGVGPTGETVGATLVLAANVTDDLIGQFTFTNGDPPRGVSARRCPE